MNRRTAEIATGVLVLVLGLFIIGFAFHSTDVADVDGYRLIAKFNKVDGVNLGSEVRLYGMDVGAVTGLSLDDETSKAVLELTLNDDVELTTDSSVKILSHGLLGGKYLELEPGGEIDYLEDGDEIAYTQDALIIIDFLDKILADSEAKRKAKREAAE